MAKHKSAFPIVSDVLISSGLTKREYFAALAMQGLLAAGHYDTVYHNAVIQADALIAELEKAENNET
jgi:hypothetical protein